VLSIIHPTAVRIVGYVFTVGKCNNRQAYVIKLFESSIYMTNEETKVKDSNGNVLKDGDAVTLIKDLPVKGTSVTLKRGTLIKNIRLTNNEEEIECNAEKVKGLVLKTCFLKKA
jgi:protein PhnA